MTPGRTSKKRPRKKEGEKLYSDKEKEYIQGTNDSSIVSKYSAERIYSRHGHASYFTPFVGADRVRRRSPIINRGYWLRMQCVEHVVSCFLSECSPGTKKVVVNLGCGYDPLPFQFLSQGFRENTLYVDIDYPALISIKARKVSTDPSLTCLLHDIQHYVEPTDKPSIRLRSDEYLAIGCDLEQLDWLNSLFEKEGFLDHEILFTAEVSVTYMRTEAANALIKWAGSLPNARFSLLEQLLPDGPKNPFGRTMLKHFETLKTPLQSVRTYPTIQDQVQRFISHHWKNAVATDLLGFWANSINKEEKDYIWSCEGFDEWEEFYIFAQHYCLLLASNNTSDSDPHAPFFRPVKPRVGCIGGESFSAQSIPDGGTMLEGTVARNDFQVRVIPSTSEKFLNRFGAGVGMDKSSMLYHGGLTVSGRTSEIVTISSNDVSTSVSCAPKARMNHTISKGGENKILLFGGRTSPAQILGDTWLYDGENWQLQDIERSGQQPLPAPRFRHCAVSNEAKEQVLIFGGISGGNTMFGGIGGGINGYTILGDWCLYSIEKKTWLPLTQVSAQGPSGETPSPRFAASMCVISDRTALLTGGIDEVGNVLDDMWKVVWTDSEVITERIRFPPEQTRLLWRFGAQLVKVNHTEVLLIGGVSGGSLMRKHETIVTIDVEKEMRVTGNCGLSMEFPPLLVGFSSGVIEGEAVIVGGGAVCFSFGAEWNQHILAITRDTEDSEPSKILVTEEDKRTRSPYAIPTVEHTEPESTGLQLKEATASAINSTNQATSVKEIPRVRITSEEDFAALMAKGEPAILDGLEFGSCVEKWNWEYLKDQVGRDRQIIVHSSSTSQMSFTTKNFTYEKTTFGAFIDAVSSPTSSSNSTSTPTQQPGLYLRSLSTTSPAKHAANLQTDFPNLAPDFTIPPQLRFVTENLHSSPLRISSANVGMWLHFDVTANVLFHVSGQKRFRLWHPRRALELGFPPGGSSSATILDPFADVSSKGDKAAQRTPFIPPDYEVILSPHDAIFIPPVFPHAALPLTPCVAVNVFFRDLDKGRYAPGKDVYGNKDLAAYEKGRLALGRVVKEFEGLPGWVRRFYMERLGAEYIERAREEDEGGDRRGGLG